MAFPTTAKQCRQEISITPLLRTRLANSEFPDLKLIPTHLRCDFRLGLSLCLRLARAILAGSKCCPPSPRSLPQPNVFLIAQNVFDRVPNVREYPGKPAALAEASMAFHRSVAEPSASVTARKAHKRRTTKTTKSVRRWKRRRGPYGSRFARPSKNDVPGSMPNMAKKSSRIRGTVLVH